MGSPSAQYGSEKDERVHEVSLTGGFYLQTTEVTQGQWKAVMKENPSGFSNCGDSCPVENVSWNECKDFIQKMNEIEKTDKYRLPTEAEWEYACRAGTQTPFFFGNCLSTDEANYNGEYPLSGCEKGMYRRKLMPIRSFQPNTWGLFDMHGNVSEWCQDRYEEYSPGSVTDPAGPSSGSRRVYRGGSWFDYAKNCRSAYRGKGIPNSRSSFLGFRIARSK